jgi:nitrous oxide reductase
MQDLDDSGAPATCAEQTPDRGLSRRSMLKGAAGAGAAGIAASALAGIAVPAAAATTAQARITRGSADVAAEGKPGEAIVVHVRDAASGEIDVYHGTSQTHLRDRDLAARIVRASR